MSRTAEYEATWPAQLKLEKEILEKEITALRKQRKDEGKFLDIVKEEKKLKELADAHVTAVEQHTAAIKVQKEKSEKQVAKLLADAKDKTETLTKEVNERIVKVQESEKALAVREAAIVAKENLLAVKENDLRIRATKLQELGAQFNKHLDSVTTKIADFKLS
jgi:uncharacterized protein (DUF3084 family)